MDPPVPIRRIAVLRAPPMFPLGDQTNQQDNTIKHAWNKKSTQAPFSLAPRATRCGGPTPWNLWLSVAIEWIQNGLRLMLKSLLKERFENGWTWWRIDTSWKRCFFNVFEVTKLAGLLQVRLIIGRSSSFGRSGPAFASTHRTRKPGLFRSRRYYRVFYKALVLILSKPFKKIQANRKVLLPPPACGAWPADVALTKLPGLDNKTIPTGFTRLTAFWGTSGVSKVLPGKPA